MEVLEHKLSAKLAIPSSPMSLSLKSNEEMLLISKGIDAITFAPTNNNKNQNKKERKKEKKKRN
jgi:hypothetical protein